MKILYLHQYFKTLEMAGGTRSYEMARRLASWGHEVHVVTARDDGTLKGNWSFENIDGVHVHWLPVEYSNKMGFWARMSAFLRFAWHSAHKAASLKSDVIFATSTPLTIALPGAYASWRQRIPLVFEVRDLWPTVPIALGILKHPFLITLATWLEKFAYKQSARVVALAPGMADGVAETGYDKRRIAIIPNGCDLGLFENQLVNDNVQSKKHYSILYIGAIGPANGVEYIPRLAKALADEYPDISIEFNVIGDGKNFESVNRLSEQLGVLNKSVFLLGAKSKREIPAWTARCTATIMTYDGPEILYRDSVSNKFFDSMAAGKPVIANFSGFSTLIAKSAGAGIILPKSNFSSAARQLINILDNKDFLHSAPKACIALAKTHFDRDALARSLEKLLLQAVSKADVDENTEIIGDKYRKLWQTVKEADRS